MLVVGPKGLFICTYIAQTSYVLLSKTKTSAILGISVFFSPNLIYIINTSALPSQGNLHLLYSIKCCNVIQYCVFFIFFSSKFITALMFFSSVLSSCKHFGCSVNGGGFLSWSIFLYIFFPLNYQSLPKLFPFFLIPNQCGPIRQTLVLLGIFLKNWIFTHL